MNRVANAPPCRVGTRTLYNLLTNICEGRGSMEDLDKLKTIGKAMQRASLCVLGQSAPKSGSVHPEIL